MSNNTPVTPLNMEQIREIAEKDGALWVINYTDRGMQRNRGNLHVSFVDETGASHGIVFPNTWIPIDAATYASSKQLIKSQTFLAAIRNTDLICISAQEAKGLLALPNAKAEIENVAKKYANIAGVVSASPDKINIFSGDTGAAPAPDFSLPTEEANTSPTDASLVNIIDMFNDRNISDGEAASRIKGLTPKPSETALIKVMSNINVTTSETYKAITYILNGEDAYTGA